MNEQVRIVLLGGSSWRDEHIRACVDDAVNVGDLARADVLYFASPIAADDVIAQLAVYPGCVICAGTTDDGIVLLAVRGGIDGGIGPCPAVASIVHASLAWGIETANA